LLFCFVKKEHIKELKGLKEDTVTCGALGGKMGNKGGVGCRFKLYETSFCFITAHLHPHMSKVEKRNKNFHEIVNTIDFGPQKNRKPEQHE
jgi:hypothetical protein